MVDILVHAEIARTWIQNNPKILWYKLPYFFGSLKLVMAVSLKISYTQFL
ncbi:MAG: hypothetical protein ACI9RO_002206 [Alteromonas macleodii]|jgi:hypothetical protein